MLKLFFVPPEIQIRWMHEVYLMILCGFCGTLLLLLYRSTKEKGILFLALAVLCWFLSGLSTFTALLHSDEHWIKMSTSVCSTANSIFLLLMLSHLDPDDLPPRIQALISKDARQFVRWVGLFILMLYGLFFGVRFWQGFYFADMVFSGFTLVLLFFALGYIFKNRVSAIVAVVSWFALATTLIAHIFRALPQNARDFLQIDEIEFVVWGSTLMFAYKPLLIVTFFALIISWLWKRSKSAGNTFEGAAEKMLRNTSNQIVVLQEQRALSQHADETPDTAVHSAASMLEYKRKTQYPRLDEMDWLIVERIAKGDKVPAITKRLGVKEGFVPSRIEKIAGAFRSGSSAQIDIMRLALLNGVLAIDQLKET